MTIDDFKSLMDDFELASLLPELDAILGKLALLARIAALEDKLNSGLFTAVQGVQPQPPLQDRQVTEEPKPAEAPAGEQKAEGGQKKNNHRRHYRHHKKPNANKES